MTAIFRNSTRAESSTDAKVALAKNEFEALQVVVAAGATSASVEVSVEAVMTDSSGKAHAGPSFVVNPVGTLATSTVARARTKRLRA